MANHKTHELKTVNPHFKDIQSGQKTFELRFNDRDYQVGDILILKEYTDSKEYTNRWLKFTITHILYHEQYPEAIAPGYCIMSLSR